MKKVSNNNGFTLVEIIVVMAIIGIVMLMASSLIGFSLKSYTNENTQWEIQQDARHAVQVISNDVRSANSIVLSNDTSFTTSNIIVPVLLINDKIRYYHKIKGDGTPDDKLYRNVNGTDNLVIENLKSISYSYSGQILYLEISTQKPGLNNVFNMSTKLYSRLY